MRGPRSSANGILSTARLRRFSHCNGMDKSDRRARIPKISATCATACLCNENIFRFRRQMLAFSVLKCPMSRDFYGYHQGGTAVFSLIEWQFVCHSILEKRGVWRRAAFCQTTADESPHPFFVFSMIQNYFRNYILCPLTFRTRFDVMMKSILVLLGFIEQTLNSQKGFGTFADSGNVRWLSTRAVEQTLCNRLQSLR